MSQAAQLADLPISELRPGVYQSREQFNQQPLNELAASIKTNGIIQPIVVRPRADHYEIIAGERRFRAAKLAGLTVVPCLIRNYSDAQAAEVCAVENINREDFNPIEEAKAYQRLVDEFGYLHEEVAAAIGQSRAKVSNMLRLLKLPSSVQAYLVNGDLSVGHGKALLSLPEQLQCQFADQTIRKQWSVSQLSNQIKRALQQSGRSLAAIDPNVRALEQGLSEHVGSPVSIEVFANKAQLQIDFHSSDVLQGILKKLGYETDEELFS